MKLSHSLDRLILDKDGLCYYEPGDNGRIAYLSNPPIKITGKLDAKPTSAELYFFSFPLNVTPDESWKRFADSRFVKIPAARVSIADQHLVIGCGSEQLQDALDAAVDAIDCANEEYADEASAVRLAIEQREAEKKKQRECEAFRHEIGKAALQRVQIRHKRR